MKNDIFVFHRLGFKLLYRVKLTGSDKKDRSGRYLIGSKIYRDEALSSFDVDNLKFIMPVERNIRKIKWNGAQIGVVWKLGADVFFYFVEVFVGECVHNQILESFLLSKSCLFDSIVLLFTTMMQEIMVII